MPPPRPRVMQASAPGSLMLLGEHAVLHGHPALVCAIHRRMHVRLEVRTDDEITLRSALGQMQFNRRRMPPAEGPFRFVLRALQTRADRLAHGFDLTIESEMSPTLGLGSSAAVTVATLAVLHRLAADGTDPGVMLAAARRIIRDVQGCGSGADAAASVYGGVVRYVAGDPPSAARVADDLPLVVRYAGYKTPTPEVIRRVDDARKREPERFARLFATLGALTDEAVGALARPDLPALGAMFNRAQDCMEQLGVSDETLAALIAALRACPGVHGAKISGSGLGDCVIGLGATEAQNLPGAPVPVGVTPDGLRFDS